MNFPTDGPADLAVPADPADRAELIRLRIDCAYDGGPFHGWARQPGGLSTVQGELEAALAKILRLPIGDRPYRTVVAGRTDAGVHARHQVCHLDIPLDTWTGLTRGNTELAPGPTLVRRLNAVLKHLGGALVIYRVEPAAPGFDARFSPIYRRYSYRIADDPANFRPLERGYTCWLNRGLNLNLLNIEAESVLGLHDFLSFCKPKEHGTTIRHLQSFAFTRGVDGIITAELVADAFCHNMVRALIGACIQVGDGTRAPGWLAQRLAARVRDSQVKLAPAEGLILEEVGYPTDAELAERADQTRAKREREDRAE